MIYVLLFFFVTAVFPLEKCRNLTVALKTYGMNPWVPFTNCVVTILRVTWRVDGINNIHERKHSIKADIASHLTALSPHNNCTLRSTVFIAHGNHFSTVISRWTFWSYLPPPSFFSSCHPQCLEALIHFRKHNLGKISPIETNHSIKAESPSTIHFPDIKSIKDRDGERERKTTSNEETFEGEKVESLVKQAVRITCFL